MCNVEMDSRLHFGNVPPTASTGESFRIDEEDRQFDRTTRNWIVGILIVMLCTVAPAVFWFVAHLPE